MYKAQEQAWKHFKVKEMTPNDRKLFFVLGLEEKKHKNVRPSLINYKLNATLLEKYNTFPPEIVKAIIQKIKKNKVSALHKMSPSNPCPWSSRKPLEEEVEKV